LLKVAGFIILSQFATEPLLGEGFQLQWIDRYPVYREDIPVIAYSDSGETIFLDRTLNGVPAESINIMNKVSPALASKIESVDDELPLFTLDEFHDDIPASSKPKNRSNRSKYRCRSCDLQVWGKPELNVICGKCHTQLVEKY